jgi:hypothetical protein
MAILCASFLDAMYTIANVTDKLTGMKNKNAKIHFYILYTGNVNAYKYKSIDRKVKALQKNLDYNELNFFEPDLVLGDIQYKFIESFNIKTSSDKINSVLQEIRNLLTPTDAYIYESVDFNDIMNRINQSNYLLSTYGEGEVEGMKNEVANLIYCIDVIYKDEKSITPDILAVINRAKYNIKLYTKVISKIEPGFDPFDYIKGTPYSYKLVKINKDLYKFDGAKIN